MSGFKLGKMTFGSLFKKPETVLYPVVKPEPPVGLKGHVVVDESTCILCSLCVKRCPCRFIEVDKKAVPGPSTTSAASNAAAAL